MEVELHFACGAIVYGLLEFGDEVWQCSAVGDTDSTQPELRVLPFAFLS